MEDFLYCPKCHGQFRDRMEVCPQCRVRLENKRYMDRRTGHRRLQIAGFITAVLVASSTITLLTGVALGLDHPYGRRGGGGGFPAGDIFGSAIGMIAIAALAVLAALPMRYYAGKAVRWTGAMCAGFLTAGGLALALGAFMLALLTAQGLGADLGSMLPLTVVAGLSSLGAAILLFMKSRAGEEEER